MIGAPVDRTLPLIGTAVGRIALLTSFLLTAFLQSPAQRHKKQKPHAQHTNAMPDSVSTNDEEITPFSDEKTAAPDTVVTSTSQNSEDGGNTAASSDVSDSLAAAAKEEIESTPVLRNVPDSVADEQKKDPAFRYANDPSVWKEDDGEKGDSLTGIARFLASKGFRYFLYCFLGGVLLFALYRIIVDNNLFFFYRRPSGTSDAPVDEAALPEEDLDQLLRKAIEEKAFRPATRFYYLKTLRMLEHRQMIKWHIQSTDEDYARQMDAQPQGESFRWLMRTYERVWYGKFPVNETQFARLSQYFQDFYSTIDHGRRA